MDNFKKKVKEIWEKVKKKTVEIYKIVKAWVIAHKAPSIVIASVLAVAIILAIVLPLTLGDKCKGEHTWDAGTETLAATCGADGVMTYTCTIKKCDGTKTEAIPATGAHDYADADCTTAKTCKVCQATDGEALGHTWVDANCTVAKTCSVCETTEGEANGHSFVATNDYAVVEGFAYVVEACENCDATQNGEKIESYVVAETNATAQAALDAAVAGQTIVLYGEVDFGTLVIRALNAEAARVFENVTITCKNGATVNNIVFNQYGVVGVVEGSFVEIKNLTFKDVAFKTSYNEQTLFLYNVETNISAVSIDGLNITNCTFAVDGEETVGNVGYFFATQGNTKSVTIGEVEYKTTHKNIVFDGCKFDGTGLTNNAISLNSLFENLKVTNCEFKNMGANTNPINFNQTQGANANIGTVEITNNTFDNFDQRAIRGNYISGGTIVISGNVLTNWTNSSDDNEVVKVSNLLYGVVVNVENNELDGTVLEMAVENGTVIFPAETTPVEEEPAPSEPADPAEPNE